MKPLESIDLFAKEEAQEDIQRDFIPKTFDDYLGQTELKKKLSLYTQAAKMRKEPLDHLLLFGSPGLGKTTLSTIMAHVMEVGITIASGPTLERMGDLVAILSNLPYRSILFIDEIHRMPTAVEEVLYNAMERFTVDVVIGQGAGAKTVTLPLNPFTLVGATTKSALISAPLLSRFGIVERLDFYTPEELALIVTQSTQFFNMSIDQESALLIGKCSRGTPRITKKLTRRVRDYAQVHGQTIITHDITQKGLAFLGIDEDGLNELDNKILRKIIETFDNRPVGLDTIASLVGEDANTIEEVVEPYLLRTGFLEKTSRGRQIPHKSLLYLKNKYFGQHTVW